MKKSASFRKNAANCLHLAEAAESDADYNRYRRMAMAWAALAEDQDWLDGEKPPEDISSDRHRPDLRRFRHRG